MEEKEKMKLREGIKKIIINHKELGFLKCQEDAIDQLEALFQSEMKRVIGEVQNNIWDEPPDFNDILKTIKEES